MICSKCLDILSIYCLRILAEAPASGLHIIM